MSEETDIEILSPEIETFPRKRFGFPALLITAFLASGFGSGAMFFVSEMVKKPIPNLAPLTGKVEVLTTENKTLKAQIVRLQRDIKALPKPKVVDLSDIQARLEDLENAEAQPIDPDLVARLEVLKTEGSEALDLSDILARLEALENRPIAAKPIIADTASETVNIEFPTAAILAVLDKSEASEGWLKKSLKKHISVQSEDNPRYLLEIITRNIEDENIDAAISAFDKLPVEAKAAAADWRESMESQ